MDYTHYIYVFFSVVVFLIFRYKARICDLRNGKLKYFYYTFVCVSTRYKFDFLFELLSMFSVCAYI